MLAEEEHGLWLIQTCTAAYVARGFPKYKMDRPFGDDMCGLACLRFDEGVRRDG